MPSSLRRAVEVATQSFVVAPRPCRSPNHRLDSGSDCGPGRGSGRLAGSRQACIARLLCTLGTCLITCLSACQSAGLPSGSARLDDHDASRLAEQWLAEASGSTADRAAAAGQPASATRPADVPSLQSVDHAAPSIGVHDNPDPSTHWLTHRVSLDAVRAPLDGLLFALANDASVQLDLRHPLSEVVTLRVEQQPLARVLEQLAEQASFRWSATDDALIVHDGRPYTASYNVEYLNIDRTTHSSVGLATQVGTINATGGSTQGGANNSQTLVENRSEHRFWASLANDLAQIVAPGSRGEHPGSAGSDEHKPAFTINRDAGLVTLHAATNVHRSVHTYLDRLNDSAQRQVLIEATVVEVTLSKHYEAGVDWRVLAEGSGGLSAVQRLTGSPQVTAESVNRLASPGGLISLVQHNRLGDIGVTLSLLEQFGDVRILSRPRIIALNNQSSVLKVVDNRVYFTVNVERQRSEEKDEIITETEIHTVPVALVMNVTPFIGRSNEVMLNVRPTLSRILGFVDDPNPELAAVSVRNSVPEIQVREMESMLRVASGSVAIIGGLMQESVDHADDRLPGVGSIPILRHLFSRERRRRSQTELLIVLRPTVLPPVSASSSALRAPLAAPSGSQQRAPLPASPPVPLARPLPHAAGRPPTVSVDQPLS